MQHLVHHSRFLLKPARTRSFSSNSIIASTLSHRLLVDDPHAPLHVEVNAHSRSVVLNRPSYLNALNIQMVKQLHKLYESWEDDPDVGFVIMKGNGSAFSAGGDIVAFRDMILKGNAEGSKETLWNVHKFIHQVHTYAKANVAILDGITMGGGAGISLPGAFRVVTDKTVYATPETLIGHHPDAGASFHLSRLPGFLGEYLALTGERLNGVEMMACGLATHYSHSSNVQAIEERLKSLVTNDPTVIDTSLKEYSDLDCLHNSSILKRMETVDKCFSHDTVEEIIDVLESEAAKTNDGWYGSILKKLIYASPLSLKVSLRSIREGRYQTLDECLIREYRLTSRTISCQISSDFCEGVRARMVDKDFAPKWDPPSLEHVSKDMVEQYFSPLGPFEHELELPARQQVSLSDEATTNHNLPLLQSLSHEATNHDR